MNDFLDKFGRRYMGESEYDPRTAQFGSRPGADVRRDIAEARGQSNQTRGMQGELGTALMDRALGRGGPSVAELQMQAGTAEAQRNALGMAAGARGVSRASAYRQAANAQSQMAADAVSKGAMLRASEQMAAQGLASQHWQAQRMADLQAQGLSIQEASARMQAEVARMQAMAQVSEGEATRGQKAAGGILTAVGGLLSDMRAKENIQPAGQTYGEQLGQALGGANYASYPGGPTRYNAGLSGGYQDPAALDAQMMSARQQNPYQQPQRNAPQEGGGLDLAGALGILSDRRAKELGAENEQLKAKLDDLGTALVSQISGEPPTKRFPDAMPPAPPAARFQYKPEFAARYGEDTAPRFGVMAQDAARHPVYAPAVQQGPDGMLGFDRDKLEQANTAMVGIEDQRIRGLEQNWDELAEALKRRGALKGKGKQMADLDAMGARAERRASGF